MMSSHNFKEMSGLRFSRILVLNRVENNKHRQPMWQCKCDCGKSKIICGKHLRSGATTSCGCLKHEKMFDANFKHGESKTRFHNIWVGMLARCTKRSNHAFSRYGGAGITVCERWMVFTNFRDDMKLSYEAHIAQFGEQDTWLDRSDNKKGYSPENCLWATRIEQANNKNNNHRVICRGKEYTLSELSRAFNVPNSRIRIRIANGWTPEEAITLPKHAKSENRRKGEIYEDYQI